MAEPQAKFWIRYFTGFTIITILILLALPWAIGGMMHYTDWVHDTIEHRSPRR